MATLYVMENVTKNLLKTPLVYLFASPRVGDATFVETYNALPGVECWRISNKNDKVPDVPADSWGFGEVATLKQVDDTGVVKDDIICHHAMTTYLHLLVDSSPLSPDCVWIPPPPIDPTTPPDVPLPYPG